MRFKLIVSANKAAKATEAIADSKLLKELLEPTSTNTWMLPERDEDFIEPLCEGIADQLERFGVECEEFEFKSIG